MAAVSPAGVADRGCWFPFGGPGARSGAGRPACVGDEAPGVAGEVRQADPGAGPVEPDGADEQVHSLLPVGELPRLGPMRTVAPRTIGLRPGRSSGRRGGQGSA